MSDDIDVQAVDNEINDQQTSTSESLRDTLKNAFEEAKEKQETAVVETKEKPVKARDVSGKFAKKEEPNETVLTQNEPISEVSPSEVKSTIAPQSWSAQAKAKWTELPTEIQAEIAKREDEVHKGFTKLDEERNFGKQLKEVITPYMPLINAEGGNPALAVRELLNTAYLLRTASPQQKGQLIWQIANQYGADMSQNSPTAAYVDPQLSQVQQELYHLKNQWQQREDYQKQQQQAAINSEINAFASDPANIHYETVKAHMAALLEKGLATDLKDAYDQAVYARPDTRSTLIAQQTSEAEAKRLAEMKAKTNAARNASASIKGAPGGAVPTTKAPERSLRDELKANFMAATGN